MFEGLIVSFGIFFLLGGVSYIGAWYTVKKDSYHMLLGIYILFLTIAQFFAAKSQTWFDFGLFQVVAPAGVLVFPFTLQITDMVNEKFGRKAVYEMIWIALITQIILVISLAFAIVLPMPENTYLPYDPLLSFAIVPAITLASWISFFVSERFDAWIYDNLKKYFEIKTESRDWWKFLWVRNVFSDILSLGIDSFLFIPLAFFILPSIQAIFDSSASILVLPIDVIVTLIVGQIIMKWILGIIDTPFMYLTRWIYEKEKRLED
ncbi:MAG: VUT family protein [Candidatus Heimdallarchaeota archaeon]|nr:VUT family protein [Candidatus Heimdallarchaeota archaeon]